MNPVTLREGRIKDVDRRNIRGILRLKARGYND